MVPALRLRLRAGMPGGQVCSGACAGGVPTFRFRPRVYLLAIFFLCFHNADIFTPNKSIQHSSNIPDAVADAEDFMWCTCQCDELPKGLSEEDRKKDVIATHEKPQTCGQCCCLVPFLETKDAEGNLIGKTVYVCDGCIFVPKYDIYNGAGEKKYRLRPDTCIGGCCVMPRCGGGGGKCCRVPFIVRDPETFEPVNGNGGKDKAQVTNLWSGFKNEFCTQRQAYHLVFPDDATQQEKLTLMGSSILVDVIHYEQQNNDNGGDG